MALVGRLGRLSLTTAAKALSNSTQQAPRVLSCVALSRYASLAQANPSEFEAYSRQRNIINLENRFPVVAVDAWVAPGKNPSSLLSFFLQPSMVVPCVLVS
jgi:hypothetical protein